MPDAGFWVAIKIVPPAAAVPKLVMYGYPDMFHSKTPLNIIHWEMFSKVNSTNSHLGEFVECTKIKEGVPIRILSLKYSFLGL